MDILCFTVFFIENKATWVLQASNVCYGAKGNTQGRFKINKEGLLIGLKLVHKSGYLTCDVKYPAFNSRWGCATRRSDWETLNVMTTISNIWRTKIFPNQKKTQLAVDGETADNLVFTNSVDPIYTESGTELHVWFTEDMEDVSEHDNGGRHCVDVYAKFRKIS